MRRFFCALVCFLLLATGTRARALDLVNTLGSSGLALINKNGGSSATFDAVMFDLQNATATIDSAAFNMKSNGASMTWILGIFSSNLGDTAPTTFVADIGTVSTSSTSFTNLSFTPGSSISLAADKRYWLVYGNTTTNQGGYNQTPTPTNTASISQITVFNSAGTIARWRSAFQNTLGLTTLSGITLTGGSTNTVNAPVFQITGTVTPVPEPATWALAGLATGLLGFAKRKRRQS